MKYSSTPLEMKWSLPNVFVLESGSYPPPHLLMHI